MTTLLIHFKKLEIILPSSVVARLYGLGSMLSTVGLTEA